MDPGICTLGAYDVPGTVLSPFSDSPMRSYYYPHFTDEKTEAESAEITCL